MVNLANVPRLVMCLTDVIRKTISNLALLWSELAVTPIWLICKQHSAGFIGIEVTKSD